MSQPVDKPSTPRRQYLCVPCGKDRNPDAHGRCRVCGVPFARAAWPDVEFTMPLDDKEYDLAGPLIQSGARIPIKTACTFCAAYPCEDGKPYCANCKASFEDGSMAKRWPPPSQEARAAAHGITRTRAEDMPAPYGRFDHGVYRGWPKPKPERALTCALCQDDRVVNYPGEGRAPCPGCSGGKH